MQVSQVYFKCKIFLEAPADISKNIFQGSHIFLNIIN